MWLRYFEPLCSCLLSRRKSSAEESDILTLTLPLAGLEQTAGTAALETLATLSELHPRVRDADVAVASAPACTSALYRFQFTVVVLVIVFCPSERAASDGAADCEEDNEQHGD